MSLCLRSKTACRRSDAFPCLVLFCTVGTPSRAHNLYINTWLYCLRYQDIVRSACIGIKTDLIGQPREQSLASCSLMDNPTPSFSWLNCWNNFVKATSSMASTAQDHGQSVSFRVFVRARGPTKLATMLIATLDIDHYSRT